jgi:PhnB protein
MHTQVYLFFDGRCDEALDFYKKNLGIEVEMLMRFKDAPKQNEAMCTPGNENKTFFSPKFGMVTDKFGVGWMVLVAS